jgi:hypothetical protein
MFLFLVVVVLGIDFRVTHSPFPCSFAFGVFQIRSPVFPRPGTVILLSNLLSSWDYRSIVFLIVKQGIIVSVYHNLLIHLPGNEHLDCLQPLAIVNIHVDFPLHFLFSQINTQE